MNNPLKLAAIATLMTLAAHPAVADQTNLVQNFSIQLAGIKQGRTVTNGNFINTSVDVVRVGNREVIAALGTATGNTFSRDARLVVSTPVLGGYATIQVRDGASKVDVTWFFVHEQLGGSLESGQWNTRTGRSSTSDFSIQRFALVEGYGSQGLDVHFDVNGVTVESSLSTANRDSSDLDADVSGTGDQSGALVILRGSISLRGGVLEVVSGGNGGPV